MRQWCVCTYIYFDTKMHRILQKFTASYLPFYSVLLFYYHYVVIFTIIDIIFSFITTLLWILYTSLLSLLLIHVDCRVTCWDQNCCRRCEGIKTAISVYFHCYSSIAWNRTFQGQKEAFVIFQSFIYVCLSRIKTHSGPLTKKRFFFEQLK